MTPEVVETTWQVSEQPQEHLHGLRLNIPARFPARDGVGAQVQQAGELGLGQAEALTDGSYVVRGEQTMLLAIDSDRALV